MLMEKARFLLFYKPVLFLVIAFIPNQINIYVEIYKQEQHGCAVVSFTAEQYCEVLNSVDQPTWK